MRGEGFRVNSGGFGRQTMTKIKDESVDGSKYLMIIEICYVLNKLVLLLMY
jgi:hypothetical protein